jgi:hypothetical protein
MKRTSLSLLAAVGATMAPMTASAQTPVVATPAPAPAVAPVATPVATAATPSTGSAAPYAPVTDAILQDNPAAQGSLSSVLSIPHRWADKRVAVFQWTGDSGVLAYGTLDNYFAGFRTASNRGDLTGGYTTPLWGAGLTINFGKQWRTTSDSINGNYVANNESGETFVADGFAVLGSYKLDQIHLSGNVAWRTASLNDSTWTTSPVPPPGQDRKRYTYSSRFNRISATLGARTYVTGDEGFAWRASATFGDLYLRPSKSRLPAEDSAFENIDIYETRIVGQVGYRFAAPNKSQLNVGFNSEFNMQNGKPSDITHDTLNQIDTLDYAWSISLRPTASILLPIAERWTLLGGAGLAIVYGANDVVAGDEEFVRSRLLTQAPTGNVGLRYAKDIWAVEAQVSSEFLTNGPFFLSGDGTANPLAQFALTVNLK